MSPCPLGRGLPGTQSFRRAPAFQPARTLISSASTEQYRKDASSTSCVGARRNPAIMPCCMVTIQAVCSPKTMPPRIYTYVCTHVCINVYMYMHTPHRLGHDALSRHFHELISVNNPLSRFWRWGWRWGWRCPLHLFLFFLPALAFFGLW